MNARIAAAVIQLLTVVPFLLGIYSVTFYGAAAQQAAETEMARQNQPLELLTRNGISFAGSEGLAIVIIVILVALAVLNLTGRRIGRILSWIFQPILLVLGVVIIPGQVFTARFLEPVLPGVDTHALVAAALDAMPAWATAASWAKLVLTTAGSVAVVVLLIRVAKATSR
ncbi:hypothetical protein ACIBKY_43005 [Nonomuraea sp. NPDC050394]|uniref:hypothetical protein n=1 Tax=Nonomuraea sp. NPDC050394 TaxID=3364363 RepID=UPI00378D059F